MEYITVNQSFTAVIPVPGSSSGDTVTYVIYKSDGSTFASGSMTFIADEMWKVSFTPTTIDTYILKVNDTTISSKRENVYQVVGALADTAAPAAGDLTTLAKVKTFLTITDSNSDTILQNLITGVSSYILNYIDRDFFSQNYIEYQDGNGSDTVILKQYPVTAVSALYDDTNRAYGSDTLIPSTDYVWYDDGRLFLDRCAKFSRGRKNIKISYTAGYASNAIPMDIQMAVWKMVGFAFKDSSTAINTPETLNVLLEAQILRNSEVKEILDGYVRYSSR